MQLVNGLVRLLVLLQPDVLIVALGVIVTPLQHSLTAANLSLTQPSASDPAIATSKAGLALSLIHCVLRFLDAAPPLPTGQHAALFVLQECRQ